ncbi:four-helix bundle copper-binding protein [Deinococcus cavernae]|uniref:Four-helix bundle copper-binding protein n=1 Tax=Deinococcus cavernae TaxID=2320857 RepID=A0A418V4X4_9DEIO|nr:four-helix bundle copper-binding protein [Deinococcus cavernae]RJF71158.1 four-helix bundle copper-binding protein [Deinococcus cavernae]
MDTISAMLQTHPNPGRFDLSALAACLSACLECLGCCTLCADACLNEQEHLAHLTKCITLNGQCADVCAATAGVLARAAQGDDEVIRAQLQACVAACRACAQECEAHAQMGMPHCQVCAECCRRCESACQRLLA